MPQLKLKLLLLVLALPMLISCATMSEDECRAADWRVIGFGDGTKGYAASRISSHQKSCSKVGVSPDLSAYTQGRSEGLIEYCTPATGYRLGLRGGRYNTVCPAELESGFSDGYSYGREIYTSQSQLKSLNNQLVKEQDDYMLIAETIQRKEKRLVQDNVPKAKRIRLLEQIKELSNVDLLNSEARLESLQREIDALRYDIDRLEASNPYSRIR